jgi:hypothetical protein
VRRCEDRILFFLCSHYVLVCRFQEDNIGHSILDKVRCYWEHVEEHLGNLGNVFITQSIGNIMRTSCEHIENKIIPKIQTPTPTFPKRIKTGIFGACSIHHWLSTNSNFVHHLFWPRLMARILWRE